MADDLSSSLKEARRIADGLHFACRKVDATPDFTFCGGPAAEAYWEYFTPARISALLGAIERHVRPITVGDSQKVCYCLYDWPCPDAVKLNGDSRG